MPSTNWETVMLHHTIKMGYNVSLKFTPQSLIIKKRSLSSCTVFNPLILIVLFWSDLDPLIYFHIPHQSQSSKKMHNSYVTPTHYQMLQRTSSVPLRLRLPAHGPLLIGRWLPLFCGATKKWTGMVSTPRTQATFSWKFERQDSQTILYIFYFTSGRSFVAI